MKALSKLGMSSHMLEIEQGRHVKTQKNTTRTAHMSKMYIKRNSLFNYLFLLATQRTSLLAESKLHNTGFDSLSNNDKLCHNVIYTSTVSNMLSKIHLHLFSNRMHATYRLIINGCYYVTLLSGTIISHLFLYHPYFMI